MSNNKHGFPRDDDRLEVYLEPRQGTVPMPSGKGLKGHNKQAARSAMSEYLATVGAPRHQAHLRVCLEGAGVHKEIIDRLIFGDPAKEE